MVSVNNKSGIVLVDKEIGATSRQVVNRACHILSIKKIGHIGTLDPFATGLLILIIDQATKIASYLEVLDKTYVAKLKLGAKTVSGDLTGEVVATSEVKSNLSIGEISAALTSFVGKRTQIPPMYSALKRDGKALYEYARAGIEVERKARDIEVFDIELISFSDGVIEFAVRVSKGTYIRTLGEDIALSLGTLGHLISLRRLAIGRFRVEDAVSIERIDTSAIIDIEHALSHLEHVEIDDRDAAYVKNGRALNLHSSEPIVLVTNRGQPLAIYERRDDGLYYCRRGLM